MILNGQFTTTESRNNFLSAFIHFCVFLSRKQKNQQSAFINMWSHDENYNKFLSLRLHDWMRIKWNIWTLHTSKVTHLSHLTNSPQYGKWHITPTIVWYMTRHKMMMNERLYARVISPQYHRANTGFIESLCLEDLLQFKESLVDSFGESHLYVCWEV